MSLKQDLEQDISEFFRQIEKQLPESQKKTLMLLFDKYMHISTTPVKWVRRDFDMIKENATRLFIDSAFPKQFNNSYSKITAAEAANFCLIVSTIAYLNSQDCLKKLPKFDLKDHNVK